MSIERDEPGFDVLFFNPFLKISGVPALIAGLVLIIIASAVGYLSSAQFNGVLNTLILPEKPLWYLAAINLFNWIISTLVFLVLGVIFTRSEFRIIDIAGTQAFARWPNIIAVLALLILKIPGVQNLPFMLYIMECMAYLSLCLMVTLMYNSYKISFDLKGGKLVATFIAGLFTAQTVSLFVIRYFSGLF